MNLKTLLPIILRLLVVAFLLLIVTPSVWAAENWRTDWPKPIRAIQQHPNLFFNQKEIDTLRQKILVDKSPAVLVNAYDSSKGAGCPMASEYKTFTIDEQFGWNNNGNELNQKAYRAAFNYMIEPTSAKGQQIRNAMISWSSSGLLTDNVWVVGFLHFGLAFCYDVSANDPAYSAADHAQIKSWFAGKADGPANPANNFVRNDEGAARDYYDNKSKASEDGMMIFALLSGDQDLVDYRAQSWMPYSYYEEVTYPENSTTAFVKSSMNNFLGFIYPSGLTHDYMRSHATNGTELHYKFFGMQVHLHALMAAQHNGLNAFDYGDEPVLRSFRSKWQNTPSYWNPMYWIARRYWPTDPILTSVSTNSGNTSASYFLQKLSPLYFYAGDQTLNVEIESSVRTGKAPLTVNFTANGRPMPGTSITGYQWNFTDGTTATGQNASHTFTTPGYHYVEVTATDNTGHKTMAIMNPPLAVGQSGNYGVEFGSSKAFATTDNHPDWWGLTGPATVEMWIKPTTADLSGLRRLFYGNIRLSLSGGKPQFETLWSNQTTASVTAPFAVSAGQWTHVAGVFTGNQIMVFVDGNKAAEQSVSTQTLGVYDSPPAVGAQLFIPPPDGPNQSTVSEFYSGVIDEIRVSKSARYTNSFTRPSGAFAPDGNTMALYHFDEGDLGWASSDGGMSMNSAGKSLHLTLRSDDMNGQKPVWVAGSPFAGGSGNITPLPATPTPVSPTTTSIPPSATPTSAPRTPGDVNGDNLVNLIDLSSLLALFGTTGTNLPADFNGDSAVNLTDLSVLLSNFGTVGSQNPTPTQPATNSPLSNLIVESFNEYVIASDLQVGSLQYTDRATVFTEVPTYLVGSHYIQTAGDDKSLVVNPLITFTTTRAATIYILHDQRITPLPSWLTDYQVQPEVARSEGGTYKIYKKDVAQGSLVSLGENGGSGPGMYSVIVK